MNLIKSTNKNLDWKEINNLRASVGWNNKRTKKQWDEILNKSSFVYTIYDKNEMIGMGRILEDGVMCMLYDIVVHKNYQNKGIGKIIMKDLMSFVKKKKYGYVNLFVDSKNKDFLISFYGKFGFKLTNTGMELTIK